MAKKRASDGKVKLQRATATPREPADLNKTPPGAQRSVPSSRTIETQVTEDSGPQVQVQPTTTTRSKPQKRPRLPNHVTITKRPIHHPAAPAPFSCSVSPKTLYISPTTPFIPTLKRIGKLLSEIQKRAQQSSASSQHNARFQNRGRGNPLLPNGRLNAADVEKDIVEGSLGGGGDGAEVVYLKATGRAIERALQIGMHFQGEDDCRVRVEMGSVRAIDDVEIRRKRGGDAEEGGGTTESEEDGSKKSAKKRKWEDDTPETRVRTLSSITIGISLK
ncbi:hypothetical protein P280DRAFT_421824 [Massarina eburnea CBS 473.64]|uniref:Uncharacterized protein n=1 Tax=Massarina eburnea CBS 473.64 TaxID=1395130 RepID=A0A6A6S6E7_9PLEO|nr:hypothetical protein P280DRAFT_421824 [Massarina eburnea CBS 473.64]